MRLNKRGEEGGLLSTLKDFLIVGMIILVIVVIFQGKLFSFSRAISPIELNQINQLCETRGKNVIGNSEISETIEGDEKDGFPDDCDTCLGGDDQKSTNSYGIADACYASTSDKIKSYKDMCKFNNGCYISSKNQCCIGKAKSKCGPECK